MIFKRELRNKESIELTSTVPVNLGIIFKQFDVGTSTMYLETLFNTEPTPFSDEKVYLVYKLKDKVVGGLVPITHKDGSEVADVCRYNKSNVGVLEVDIDHEVLQYSGEVISELIIMSADEKNRFTSPSLKFKIEPSLVSNTNAPSSNKAICGEFLCDEAKCGEGVDSEIDTISNFIPNTFINKRLLDIINAR